MEWKQLLATIREAGDKATQAAVRDSSIESLRLQLAFGRVYDFAKSRASKSGPVFFLRHSDFVTDPIGLNTAHYFRDIKKLQGNARVFQLLCSECGFIVTIVYAEQVDRRDDHFMILELPSAST